MIASPRPPNRWALIVGVNEYRYLPYARLDGCVNDAREMAQALVDRFEFPGENVTLLLDQQATRAAIRGSMEELVHKVKQDDVVVFHFSGHGSQMTDREGDEADGMDETILTHDTGRHDHENRDITDDEIYDWLLKLTAVTPYVTLVFDCCHSGTISREDSFRRARVREVEPDRRPLAELPPSPLPKLRDLKEMAGAKGASGWLPPSERYTLIAACRNKEKANEVEFRGSTHGALTYHLLQELRSAPAGTTYRDILDAVTRQISSEYPDQHPQLEGARDRELFGLTWTDYPRFVPILKVSDGRIFLGAGAATGMLSGSLLTVHPAGIRQIQGAEPLGRLQVTQVRAATSDAVPVGDLGWDLDKPKWAVEDAGYCDRHLAVAVEVPAGWEVKGDEMARQIEASPVLRRVPASAAGATVMLVPPREKVAPGSSAPGLGVLEEATWVVVEPGGEITLPPFRVGGEATALRVVQNLEKKARYQNALELKNPDSALVGQVDLILRRRGNGGEWIEVTDPLGDGVEEGEAISFEIVHHHDANLFAFLVDFGLAGQIQLMYPLSGSYEPLEPGNPVYVGATKGGEMEPFLPEIFPYDASANGLRRDRGVSTLKLFVSTHPLDLWLLEQKGYRADQKPPVLKPRAFKPRAWKQREGAEDWTTVEREIVLRRAATQS